MGSSNQGQRVTQMFTSSWKAYTITPTRQFLLQKTVIPYLAGGTTSLDDSRSSNNDEMPMRSSSLKATSPSMVQVHSALTPRRTMVSRLMTLSISQVEPIRSHVEMPSTSMTNSISLVRPWPSPDADEDAVKVDNDEYFDGTICSFRQQKWPHLQRTMESCFWQSHRPAEPTR